MQHLDEGTIHSWLDGALAPDEAAQVEAHVAECPECAAAVAEARGFIAASSRILTALDNAPRGVIPVAAPKRRVDPIVWRVAATLLVVAAGTLAVFRNGGREAASSSANFDSSSTTTTAVAPAVSGPDETAKTTAETAQPATKSENLPRNTAIAGARPTAEPTEKVMERRKATDAVGATKQTLAAAPPPVSDLGKARALAPQPSMPARASVAGGQVGGATGQTSPSSGYVNAEPSTPRILIRGNSLPLTARDSVTAVAPLKIVGTRRQIGARVTLYEVAPNDTVTLTELMSTQLSAVVTTEMPTVLQEGRAAKSSAAAPPPPQQRADATVANPRPAPVTGIETVNGVTTITWTDATAGAVLKLSGRIPVAQLQVIKFRIEQERAAAAAAARKNP